MNFQNILQSIADADPELYERCSTRRRLIRNWMPKVALTALPFAFGSLFRKAYGKADDAVIDTLRFALMLERLESSFYNLALQQAGLIPSQERPAIELMAANETAHVSFVELMINSAGGSAAGVPHQFDYTGGRGSGVGPFTDVFDRYASFLEVAQLLEETGLRAYKGAMPDLMGHNEILQGALQIHSVEARHAAKLRQMRADHSFAGIRPWITQAESGIPNAAAQASYAGEGNTLQGGADLLLLTSLSGDALTEAFDEPMGRDVAMAIVSNFIQA